MWKLLTAGFEYQKVSILLGFFFVVSTAWLMYFLMVSIINPAVSHDHSRLILILGLLLIGFSIYFILRDFLLDFFARIGWTKEKRRITILLVGLGLFFMGTFT